jgi:hypothetical protein
VEKAHFIQPTAGKTKHGRKPIKINAKTNNYPAKQTNNAAIGYKAAPGRATIAPKRLFRKATLYKNGALC